MTEDKNYQEVELVKLLLKHDQQAFSFLYDNYAATLNGVIIKIAGVSQEEDILQEVFIKIWNNIHEYDKAKEGLLKWMINITRKLVLEKLNSKGIQYAPIPGEKNL